MNSSVRDAGVNSSGITSQELKAHLWEAAYGCLPQMAQGNRPQQEPDNGNYRAVEPCDPRRSFTSNHTPIVGSNRAIGPP